MPRLPDPHQAARLIAMLLAFATLGAWSAILLAPRADELPPVLDATPAARAADVTPVALWFGRDRALGTDVVVQGLIADGPRSAAVISVNGRPASAISMRQREPSGAAVLQGIDAQGLILDLGGTPLRAAPPSRPSAPPGIQPVRP